LALHLLSKLLFESCSLCVAIKMPTIRFISISSVIQRFIIIVSSVILFIKDLLVPHLMERLELQSAQGRELPVLAIMHKRLLDRMVFLARRNTPIKYL